MRYVDLDALVLPDGWLERARVAAEAVAAGGDPEVGSAVWRELKDRLADLLPDKKCWYCESPVDRADNAVDHFRPKGRVSDTQPPHAGYRWLAFNAKNYRYACTFCNSLRKGVDGGSAGGKADRFPLVDETKRVYVPGPVDQERPVLLDPCEFGDWALLGCKQENGEPCATSEDATDKYRVGESIAIYHLRYEPTCKQRHRVAIQLLSDVAQAKRLFPLAKADEFRARDFKDCARRIKRVIGRTSPFSGEMIFLLRTQRHSDHSWIQDVLEA